MGRRRDKGHERRIAVERVDRLLDLAARTPGRADRYATLARRVALRYQLAGRGPGLSRVCRSCQTFLVPGSTQRVRLNGGRVVATCLRCGRAQRRPLSPRAPKD